MKDTLELGAWNKLPHYSVQVNIELRGKYDYQTYRKETLRTTC
jgi:hypothetical protein